MAGTRAGRFARIPAHTDTGPGPYSSPEVSRSHGSRLDRRRRSKTAVSSLARHLLDEMPQRGRFGFVADDRRPGRRTAVGRRRRLRRGYPRPIWSGAGLGLPADGQFWPRRRYSSPDLRIRVRFDPDQQIRPESTLGSDPLTRVGSDPIRINGSDPSQRPGRIR